MQAKTQNKTAIPGMSLHLHVHYFLNLKTQNEERNLAVRVPQSTGLASMLGWSCGCSLSELLGAGLSWGSWWESSPSLSGASPCGLGFPESCSLTLFQEETWYKCKKTQHNRWRAEDLVAIFKTILYLILISFLPPSLPPSSILPPSFPPYFSSSFPSSLIHPLTPLFYSAYSWPAPAVSQVLSWVPGTGKAPTRWNQFSWNKHIDKRVPSS